MRMGIDQMLESKAGTHPCLDEQLQYTYQGKPMVYLGRVANKICRHYDIKQDVWFATFDWAVLIRLTDQAIRFKELPKFPSMRRDLALVISKDVKYEQLEKLAQETAGPLLKAINLFDVYEGDKLGDGKQSYALSFVLQDEEKTLTDELADKVMQKLMTNFEKSLGATVRQ
jgi:phenylalanyl-tRNA synthetase beta chain